MRKERCELQRGQRGGSKERAYFTRPSGIMEISGARKQEAVSALVESIRAKARAKRASHLELLRIFGDSTDQGVVGGDQAEATRRHLFRKKGKVYMLTNTVTGKSYVGQTIQRPNARMRQHAGGKQRGHSRSGMPSLIQNSIAKHGWDAFTWVILEKNIAHTPVEILDARERHWIQVKQTMHPNGYNMDAGGQCGKEYTQEMRDAKSKAMMPWARSEKSRARKRELWADAEFKEARCKERKVIQNELANVQSRRDTWDAKRDERIQAITDPKERMRAIKEARNNAKQGVKKAVRRGVTGRDLWGEFEARWGSDEQWQEWLKDGEDASWMPFVSRSVDTEGGV